MRMKVISGILLLGASLPLISQVVPSATSGGHSQWAIGAGTSRINPDMGHGDLYGGTLWVDYSLNRMLPMLHGAGLEIEASDISLDRSPTENALREDVALGGATYSFGRFRRFRPFAKFEVGLGNMDYLVSKTRSYHQSRTVTAMGGGLDYRAFRNIWARLAYEYQDFPDFFLGTRAKPTSLPLHPQGFTLGAMYHF